MRRSLWLVPLILGFVSAPVGSGQTLRLRIPEQNGLDAVRDYVAALQRTDTAFLANWARFHNGWRGSPIKDNCSHKNAPFLVWHHAYLVLTEELFAKVLGRAEFAMPYWSPVQSGTVPDVFSCQSDDCRSLSQANRFQGVSVSFNNAHAKWNELSNCIDSSFFCSFDCNGERYDPLGGKGIEDGNKTREGSIEKWVHDPVHDAGCIGPSDNLRCSPIGLSNTAARDPLFQPFHAGIDAGFVALLKKANIKCEVCADGFRGEAGFQDWASVYFKLPEPKCLSVNGNTITIDGNAEYMPGKKCSGLPTRSAGAIPFREYYLKDILRDERFWKVGYQGSQPGEVLGVGIPCPKEGKPAGCIYEASGQIRCAQATPIESLRLSKRFLWITGEPYRGDKSQLSDSYFRLRFESGNPRARKGAAYSVTIQSASGSFKAGYFQLTPWEMSLHEGENHVFAHQPTLFEFLPDSEGQKRIAELLANGKRISAKVSPVNPAHGKVGRRAVFLDLLPKKRVQ